MRKPGMRSWLVTPSPTSAEFAAALASEADIVVLEGAAPADARATARRLVATIGAGDDLDACMPLAPWAILAACADAADVQRLGVKLAVSEARFGLADGATRIVAAIVDATGLMRLESFSRASPRLVALACCAGTPQPDLARGLVALAAAAAGVAAIEGVGDPNTLERDAALACAAGYSGKVATTTEGVAIVNRVFRTP